MKSFLWSGSDMRTTRAKVAWDQVYLSKKGRGARNKKDNRMEQDCFVETHLEPVQ
jgi:hypothetical protein